MTTAPFTSKLHVVEDDPKSPLRRADPGSFWIIFDGLDPYNNEDHAEMVWDTIVWNEKFGCVFSERDAYPNSIKKPDNYYVVDVFDKEAFRFIFKAFISEMYPGSSIEEFPGMDPDEVMEWMYLEENNIPLCDYLGIDVDDLIEYYDPLSDCDEDE